jgi:hypothetical protein
MLTSSPPSPLAPKASTLTSFGFGGEVEGEGEAEGMVTMRDVL